MPRPNNFEQFGATMTPDEMKAAQQKNRMKVRGKTFGAAMTPNEMQEMARQLRESPGSVEGAINQRNYMNEEAGREASKYLR